MLLPNNMTGPVTTRILAFLVLKSKECWQKAPPHDSGVRTKFKLFFSRISKVIPSYKLCLYDTVLSPWLPKGEKKNPIYFKFQLLSCWISITKWPSPKQCLWIVLIFSFDSGYHLSLKTYPKQATHIFYTHNNKI